MSTGGKKERDFVVFFTYSTSAARSVQYSAPATFIPNKIYFFLAKSIPGKLALLNKQCLLAELAPAIV